MLSERRRLSDVATCRSASGDVMHCAGTAGHSTHERALDTVRHATGDPVSAMVNASISQVVLLYSSGSSFVFENRKRHSGSSDGTKARLASTQRRHVRSRASPVRRLHVARTHDSSIPPRTLPRRPARRDKTRAQTFTFPYFCRKVVVCARVLTLASRITPTQTPSRPGAPSNLLLNRFANQKETIEE